MATSKRSLYKPATQHISTPKEKRKALAQGRLVMNSASNIVASQKSGNEPNDDGVSKTEQRLGLKLSNQDPVAAKFSNSELGHSLMAKQNAGFDFSGKHVENSATPRKTVPQVLRHESPKAAQPTASLDLSDTEDERCQKQVSEVIVVDARRELKSLDDTEVDISLHYGHSPAKVICHAPGKVHSDLRNTGNVDQAAKVLVDKVPSVCILDDEGRNFMESRKEVSMHKVPTVVRESGIVGGAVEPKPSLKSSGAGSLPDDVNQQTLHFNALMARSDQKGQKVSANHLVVDSSDQGSEFSENSSSVESETHDGIKSTSAPVNTKSIAVPSSEEVVKPTTKKKGTRIVASRYLQATNNNKGPLRATDRSVLGNANVHGGTFSHQNFLQKQQSSSLNRTNRCNTTLRKHRSATQLTGDTPDPKDNCKQVCASTPYADGTAYFGNENADVSAISTLPTGHRLGPSLGLFPRSGSGDALHDHSRLGGSSEFDSGLSARGQKKKRIVSEMNQWTLELLYARHLQWAFLASKAQKTLHDQEKQAMEQLSSLAELSSQQNERVAELELELEKLRHINNLDEALDLQFSGLNCSTDKLPKLKEQHHHLAKALDTTRHHIQTKGIYVPDNDDQYHDGIARALQESDQLLGEVCVMTRSHAEGTNHCAQVLQAMEKVIDRETSELTRCNLLLSAADTLATQENSLIVQQILTRSEN